MATLKACGYSCFGLTCTRRPHPATVPHHDSVAGATWPIAAPVDGQEEPSNSRLATTITGYGAVEWTPGYGAVQLTEEEKRREARASKSWLNWLQFWGTSGELPPAPEGKTLVAHRTRRAD